MNQHICNALKKLIAGCERARGLISIYDYMERNAPKALDCNDILRSSLLLSVSSLDLFVHDVYREECLYRLATRKSISGLRVPFEVVITQPVDQLAILDEGLRHCNSFKSFVAPDKLAECLSDLVPKPFKEISSIIGINEKLIKDTLKGIVELRNRIAHEADVNPNYGGVELWPIYREDVIKSIDFIGTLSGGIATMIGGQQ